MNPCISLTLTASLATATAALGQAPPDYGFTFLTVGAPGNPPATPDEFQNLAGLGPIGSVGYPFRIAQTEVTCSQWLEFVRAYVAVNPAAAEDGGLHGTEVLRVNPGESPPLFTIGAGMDNVACMFGWYYAARFCNWLHNGKIGDRWAFETGAYDSSGWGPGGAGQTHHSPNALFWIATLDEWTKAVYFDTDRFGPGQPGYWLYPYRSNTPPIGGLPGTPGAQTSAGSFDDPGNSLHFYPVGSYPLAQTPWGLLDASGGVEEWNEAVFQFGMRPARGTCSWSGETSYWDRLDVIDAGFPIEYFGLRLASATTLHPPCNSPDLNCDGQINNADIAAFFDCLAGRCQACATADFDNDGDPGTDADIEAFFRLLAGGSC